MNSNEIYDTYNDLSVMEAFEVFDAQNVDIDSIKASLGGEVVREYLDWIYANVE